MITILIPAYRAMLSETLESLYNQTYRDFADWDFWFRCFKAGKSAYHLEEPLFMYRKYSSNGGKDLDRQASTQQIIDIHPEVIMPKRFFFLNLLRKMRITFRI